MAATETVIVRGEDVALDLIIWRRLRRPFNGLVEQVLDANQGLAAKGPVLPVGTVIEIPVEVLTPPTVKKATAVRLWD